MSRTDPVRVTVLDYRMSNLRSAVKALERLGAAATVARAADEWLATVAHKATSDD